MTPPNVSPWQRPHNLALLLKLTQNKKRIDQLLLSLSLSPATAFSLSLSLVHKPLRHSSSIYLSSVLYSPLSLTLFLSQFHPQTPFHLRFTCSRMQAVVLSPSLSFPQVTLTGLFNLILLSSRESTLYSFSVP